MNSEYHYIPSIPNDKIQRQTDVATAFCAASQRQFSIGPIFRGAEINGIDAIIELDGKAIALELIAYHQTDEMHEDEANNSQAKAALAEGLAKKNVKKLSWYICWSFEKRSDMSYYGTSERAKIPHKNHLGTFVQDAEKLARRVCSKRKCLGKDLRFVSDIRSEIVASHEHCLLNTDFPTISQYCDSIIISVEESSSIPIIHTNCDGRGMFFDDKNLKRSVRKHFEKYDFKKNKAGERPLWLIVHSDGYPPSRNLPELWRPKVLQLLEELRKQEQPKYDKIFWMECARSCEGAKLFEVASGMLSRDEVAGKHVPRFA